MILFMPQRDLASWTGQIPLGALHLFNVLLHPKKKKQTKKNTKQNQH